MSRDEKAAQDEEEQQLLDINKATPQQLQMANQQLENEVNGLAQSTTSLNEASIRMQAALACVEHMSQETDGKQVLVPITSALYVDGKLKEPRKVLVDIGTGYFIEASVEHAIKIIKKRVDILSAKHKTVQETMQIKRMQLQRVAIEMQKRMAAAQAAQAAQGTA
uniref:Prefoldin subunit 5 n=1 Tax=Noctiluca scintillans TaxID=2966 RepID=A0A7S1EVL1_NOCSC|eukprot:CAMPEP_0194492696 /NCGR_PEP_ID=MMETSP0253-20130528/11166_1 /TAXON_ID=2966 /ORGANISM="Noctiluca scintillans" /LENGTH=164 /DNA_ID=CAMNT_0039333597 /DNA_START=29 /DNA_END=523 /DNA_ORIENTATION=-